MSFFHFHAHLTDSQLSADDNWLPEWNFLLRCMCGNWIEDIQNAIYKHWGNTCDT